MRSRTVLHVALADSEQIFKAPEVNRRMKDKAAESFLHLIFDRIGGGRESICATGHCFDDFRSKLTGDTPSVTAIRALRMQKDQLQVGHTIHRSDSGRQASERPPCCHKESAGACLYPNLAHVERCGCLPVAEVGHQKGPRDDVEQFFLIGRQARPNLPQFVDRVDVGNDSVMARTLQPLVVESAARSLADDWRVGHGDCAE